MTIQEHGKVLGKVARLAGLSVGLFAGGYAYPEYNLGASCGIGVAVGVMGAFGFILISVVPYGVLLGCLGYKE